MENNDNFEHCGPLSNNFKLSENKIFDFEPHFTKECFVKDLADRLDRDKSNENCSNEDKHIRIPSEISNSNCSSEMSAQLLRRLSLINKFDPLLIRPQTSKVNNDSVNTYDIQDKAKVSSEIYDTVFLKEIRNGTISKNYVGDTSSLESPMRVAKPISQNVLVFENTRPTKIYSQEEFQQALRIQELSLQRKFSQELLEYKKTWEAKNQELHIELSRLTTLKRTYRMILSEISAALEILQINKEKNQAKFEDLCVSNEKLKVDILATKENCFKMENAFSDIYKLYEIAKGILKNYKENENHLKKNIERVQSEIHEQEITNDFLKSRIQELKDEAAKELDNSEKYADTQIMILKAQIKKGENKICSLESDLKQAKSNRNNILSINKDLKKMFSA